MYTVYRFMPMYAKHATCWLFGGSSWNQPQNLQLSSLSWRRNGENLVLWDGTFAPWHPNDLVRWCPRVQMMSEDVYVQTCCQMDKCFAMKYLWVLRTWKKRTCQMLCRLQRCCDYRLWFRNTREDWGFFQAAYLSPLFVTCQGTYWRVTWKKTIVTAIIASLPCCRRGTHCFAKDTSSTTQTWKHQQPLHTTCWTLGSREVGSKAAWQENSGPPFTTHSSNRYSTFPLALTIGYSYVIYCDYWYLMIFCLFVWYTVPI